MDELVGFNRWVAIVLAFSALIGPAVVLIPLFWVRAFAASVSGYFVVTASLIGFVAGALLIRAESLGIETSLFFRSVSFCLAAIYIVVLGLAAASIGRMGKDGTSPWVRAASIAVLVYTIPVGFVPIAMVLDGSNGWGTTIQYYAEFTYRMYDMISFGYLSNFGVGGYPQIVTLTADGSLSVLLFNATMGLFMFSAIVQIALPRLTSSGEQRLSALVGSPPPRG